MRIVILIALLAILACLAAAVFYMLRRPQATQTMTADDVAQVRSRQMAKALTWRIAISIAIFSAILLAWWFGWLTPGGIALQPR